MPKGGIELTNARREEIINACEKLYKTMSFKEITIKEIGSVTSFTRTSIYNYFHTKEEIFLALLQREYELWADELEEITKEHDALSPDELADKIAHSLENRMQLLKLLSMNHYDMEENSRDERLTEFKASYGKARDGMQMCIQKFCPKMNDKELQDFIYSFFPFMFGIYPYAVVTDKQKEAMARSDIGYVYLTAYEIVYNCVIKLLGDNSEKYKGGKCNEK